MNVIAAYRAHQALTEEQKRVLAVKTIDASHTPDRWITLLDGIARYDRHADALRKTAGVSGLIALAAAVVLGGFVVGSRALFGVLAVVGVLALVLYFVLRRKDLPNNLRGFVLPAIALLREEMEPRTVLHLLIDLRGATTADKVVVPTATVADSSARKVVQTVYHDRWMAGEATLADGCRLQWEIGDRIRERKITTRRRKTKTKRKYKVRRLVEVRVGLPGEGYALAEQPAGLRPDDRVALKPGEKRNEFRVRRMTESTMLDAPMEPNEWLDAIAAAYRQVSRKPAPGGAQP
jgi:hypothetical protein